METTLQRATFDVKATKGRTVTGLASTWDIDRAGDVVLPGAYSRWLDEWKSSGRSIPLLDNHRYESTESALGTLTDAEETTKGLKAEFLVIDGPRGDHLLNQIKIRAVNSFSIGYRARRHRAPTDSERKMGVRRVLEDVDLHEISAVLFPENQYAMIEGIKNRLPEMPADELGSLYQEITSRLIERKSETDIQEWIAEHHKTIRSQNGHLLRDAPPADAAAAPPEEKTGTPEATPDPSADSQKATDADEIRRVELLRDMKLRHLMEETT
jgi:HK97 family phage prohead protease